MRNVAKRKLRELRKSDDTIGLMRVQHLVAQEYGFPSWGHLLGTKNADVQAAIDQHEARSTA